MNRPKHKRIGVRRTVKGRRVARKIELAPPAKLVKTMGKTRASIFFNAIANVVRKQYSHWSEVQIRRETIRRTTTKFKVERAKPGPRTII